MNSGLPSPPAIDNLTQNYTCSGECQVRIVGLLGGMSWQSTQSYYQLINEDVQAWKGASFRPLLIKSFDFAEIEALQSSGQWADAGSLLAKQAEALQAAGAEAIALATNTMHKLADDIISAVNVPFLHIADATAEAILASPSRKPLLLATAFTMEQDFYTAPLDASLASAGRQFIYRKYIIARPSIR